MSARTRAFASPTPTGPTPARIALAAALGVAAALAAGCSGEARPFEEAVEVSELDLASLDIERPAGSLSPLVVNAGQRLDFELSGTNSTGTAVEISGNDRDWRVSDSSVASIDDDGVFVARADGEVSVEARIGDVVTPLFDVTVSTSTIESITAVSGPDALDPCVGAEYRAEALYADESRRALSAADIVWSSDTPAARLEENEDGSVTFSAPRPGTVQLTATAGSASFARPLVVNESLADGALEIGPDTLAARVGDTQSLTATGTFVDADGGTREQIVTEGVTWSITAGGEFASVSDEAGSRGLVEALDEGNATVRASCGDVFDEDVFDAQARSSSGDGDGDDDGLAFEDASGDDVLTVSLAERFVDLRVSTGEDYQPGEDVSREATFSIVDDGEDQQVLALIEDSAGFERLQLFQTGSVDLRVVAAGRRATLTVFVED